MDRLFISSLCLVFLIVAPALAEPKGVGSVKVISGYVEVVRDKTAQRLSLGATIYQGDIIRTATFGRLGLTFEDGTLLTLGPNGEITIDEFVYDPAENDLSFATSLTYGVLSFTSGVISRLSPETVSVSTPVATIGIRGTRFAVSVENP